MHRTNFIEPLAGSSGRTVSLDRVLRVGLALVFAAAAIPKVIDARSSVHMFAQIGAGHWLQYLVGTTELIGAVGLLCSAVTGLAAAGLCLDMVGATVINAAVLHSRVLVLTAVLAVLLGVVARRHWATTRQLPTKLRKGRLALSTPRRGALSLRGGQ
jgi:putative oxidoreductase